ncbi:hypothetical protein [Magnetospirillum sp. UT-4]|uniref:hypothetical protein n=1 Tax=Magnetospirillum sp. UT-4 TaxID=2681467 RepID=UPI00137E929C|nr:hypothetical protein [Magnetospirillum sp. UT-4]CAA7613433.1 conserved membrane hypothetical protein [Magnetospirillum sp. UT-4]
MSLTRFSPQVVKAFGLPAAEPAALLRLAAPWFALALAAHAGRGLPFPGSQIAALVVSAIAVGLFGHAWQRFAATGERPAGPVVLVLGWRAFAWAGAYQLMLGFEGAVATLLGIVLEGVANAHALAFAGTQLFQLLFGPMLLLLPHLALARRGEGKASLAEMVAAGGLAVGLGYVLVNLPFLFVTLAWADVAVQLPDGPAFTFAAGVVQYLVSFLGLAVSAGYFGLVWTELRDTVTPLAARKPE